ncbi:MAG TPA: guanylate kinase [Polyangiaceae bacterium]
MSNSLRPLPLIISSPSGAGKTTLTGRLLKADLGLAFSVSHTTRAPRSSEQDGREYHFVDRATFANLIEQGEFLEWAEVHGNLYGTSKNELTKNQQLRGIIFDIDHQGARQIKCAEPDAVAIFILPPSMAILEQRLRGRASEDEATVQRRFKVATREIEHYGLFDYVLVNDDIDEATTKLTSIFRAEECRRQRAARLAEQLLAEGRELSGAKLGE